MFSDKKVAQYINDNFEPTWQSVRAVPTIDIDFGEGKKLTRTLHGNIVTHVVNAQGQVLDSLPGIYDPATYLAQLDQFRLLPKYIANQRAKNHTNRKLALRDYHNAQISALSGGKNRMKLLAFGPEIFLRESPLPETHAFASARMPNLESAEEVANWKQLLDESTFNETVRRRQIHQVLAQAGLVTPDSITKQLYKEVLHCDLDDPYLGLGEALFANYPFGKEDSTRP